jgi:hypothetical protein
MALKNNCSIIAILMFCSAIAGAKTQLPELIAKQATNNLRLISQDGKFTYYQKRSGSLFFSTNYKVTELIKGAPDSHYTVFVGDEQTKIVITQNENFHNYFSLRNAENIYIADYGALTVHQIGKGVAPKLHLQDTWISYFSPSERMLVFEHTTNSALKFSIRLNNRINPYFVPDVIMADDSSIYYTDLGENGIPGIIEYKRNLSKGEIIYRGPTPMSKLEICYDHATLFIAQLGINSSPQGSTLSQITFPFKDFKTRQIFYSAPLNDLGHLVCNFDQDAIYFIKNTGSALAALYDIAEYNFKTKTLKVLTELKDSTSLINMDGTLLTFDHGTYYIIKGKSDFKTIDSLKSKPEPAAQLAPPKKEESDDE